MRKKWKRTALVLAAALTITSLPAAADKEVKAEGYDVSNPVVTSTLSTWDTLTFGNYWQEDTNGDGVADQNDDKQPIQWRVLSVNGNDAFLMAEKTLDNQYFNEHPKSSTGGGKELWSTWETCTLRTWLNDTFLNAAFNDDEKNAIADTTVVTPGEDPWNTGTLTDGGKDTVDKVYLLSLAEIRNSEYGFDSQPEGYLGHGQDCWRLSQTIASTNTAYATAQGAITFEEKEAREQYPSEIRAIGNTYYWWLRSPGMDGMSTTGVLIGIVDITGATQNEKLGIRPVIHLDLSKTSLWTKGEPVSAENDGYALEVASSASPSPSATPENTPTAEPSETPAATPENTPSVEPSETPAATPESTPTATPIETPASIPSTTIPATNAPTQSPASNATQTPVTNATQTPAAATDKPVIQPSETTAAPATMAKIGKVKIQSAKNVKGKKIQLKWKKVKGAASYKVQYGIGKELSKEKTARTAKTTLTLKGLRKGKIYRIRVCACDAKGKKGKWSSVKKVKVRK